MSVQGIDTAARLTAGQAAILRENGVSFAARYLVPAQYGKALTADEAKALRGAGLAVMLCWETTAKRMRDGAAAGAADGAKARELAEAMGVPAGTCIYFAADWDVQDAELPAVEAYYRAARIAAGPYNAGVYGGQRVIAALSGVTGWLWQCAAWSDTFASYATVVQYQWQGGPEAKALAAKAGAAVDLDRAASTAGMWLPEGAPHPSAAPTPFPQGEGNETDGDADEKEEEPMRPKNLRAFLAAAGIRAARTLAQTAIATIGTAAVLSEIDWGVVASASVLAALLSVLTSIATGLPEVDG